MDAYTGKPVYNKMIYEYTAKNGEVVERASDPGVWELMYFGHACVDEKYRETNKGTGETGL